MGQLLPPIAGRGGDPESLPPCTATGERARLPIPVELIFPSSSTSSTSARSAARLQAGEASNMGQPAYDDRVLARTAPVAALLAPGHTGRLIYAETEYNDNGVDWRLAVRNFFGFAGSLLADEAERLVDEHAAPDTTTGTSEPVLVVVEVLP